LRERSFCACAAAGRDAGDPSRPWIQHDVHRRGSRPNSGTGDHRRGTGQSGEGRVRAGRAEHEPDARVSRDHWSATGGAVSVSYKTRKIASTSTTWQRKPTVKAAVRSTGTPIV